MFHVGCRTKASGTYWMCYPLSHGWNEFVVICWALPNLLGFLNSKENIVVVRVIVATTLWFFAYVFVRFDMFCLVLLLASS